MNSLGIKALLYRLNRWLVGLIARPTLVGGDNLSDDAEYVYVLHARALSDLIILDLICEQDQLPPPLQGVQISDWQENRRFFFLYRSAAGRITMQSQSPRLKRLVEAPVDVRRTIQLVPVSIFWGRSTNEEGSWFRSLTSANWAVTGRFKRFVNLFVNRRNIFVHTGEPIRLLDAAAADTEPGIALRRTSRYLRVRLRQQRITTLGPDISHRRTLLNQIVRSKAVAEAVEREVKNGMKPKKAEALAYKHARTIASDMSNTNIRVLARLLKWFWTKIYDGIDVNGLLNIDAASRTHTLVYVPSHRSHLDYLLLSYLLYYKGYMIPHIAAGDNLNLPLVGGILRRGGAFFMRRTFRGEVLYTAVFTEYLYQVYRRGHCVEFFPEGGRTRTGRLLPARLGLIKMSLDHQARGLPKPLAFVPVYFGYEKLVEASSYLSELRGSGKENESVLDVLRNLRLIRQNFGRVEVNIGQPILLDEWLRTHPSATEAEQPRLLGADILRAINAQASLNPVNLIALTTLATPKLVIERNDLVRQVATYQQLIKQLHPHPPYFISQLTPDAVIERVESLGLLHSESTDFGAVVHHDEFTAVLMTWYKNNVVHTLALPSLIACLLINRRRGVGAEDLPRMVERVYPYLIEELSCDPANLDQALEAMLDQQLVTADSDGVLHPPAPNEPGHRQLALLANLVSQTLERMYIVIQQLAIVRSTREDLRRAAQATAKRISRVYGINAPEFFDLRLFDLFIDGLIRRGIVSTDEEGYLDYDSSLKDVLRAAEFVIEPQIRYGVLATTNGSADNAQPEAPSVTP